MRHRLPNKHPAESKWVTLPFKKELRDGATLQTVTLVSITVAAGVDASPALVLDGVPMVHPTLPEAYQVVQGGVLGCDYDIDYLATDSDGRRHICQFRLPVRPEVARA